MNSLQPGGEASRRVLGGSGCAIPHDGHRVRGGCTSSAPSSPIHPIPFCIHDNYIRIVGGLRTWGSVAHVLLWTTTWLRLITGRVARTHMLFHRVVGVVVVRKQKPRPWLLEFLRVVDVCACYRRQAAHFGVDGSSTRRCNAIGTGDRWFIACTMNQDELGMTHAKKQTIYLRQPGMRASTIVNMKMVGGGAVTVVQTCWQSILGLYRDCWAR